jgi:uncharacterized protein DUF2786
VTSKQELLDKIRKLNNHAESAAAIGNETEAQTFAAKVQELLTSYKLSMNDVRQAGKPVEEPINVVYLTWEDLGLAKRSRRIAWAESLAMLVASAYYCEFIISYGRIGMFVGTDTDREIARFMFITLGRALERIAREEYHAFWQANAIEGKLPEHKQGFKEGFMMGFLRRLRERFDEEIKPKVDPAAQATTAAIVLVKKNSLDKTRSWIKDNMKLRSLGDLSMGSSNREGYDRGRKVANDLNLKANPIAKTGKSHPQLS